jgi:ABC-type Fe3+ transport system substrate-binding protein
MTTTSQTTSSPAQSRDRNTKLSLGLLVSSLALAYAPIPGLNNTITIVSGTELQTALQLLETPFEKAHPDIKLELKSQGSQDIINNYLDGKNEFNPTILIPANGSLLADLQQRWQAQNNGDAAFQEPPKPIAKTFLVGIGWPDRGKVLFPNDQFQWPRVQQALQGKTWSAIGGPANWGSFDLLTTDPTRSNSGQLTLSLLLQGTTGQPGQPITVASLNSPAAQATIGLVKRSIYQPARSTDTLLQEFISKGPNEADIATVYESVALQRWQQLSQNQRKPYQIYYLNPTFETTATAAIVKRNVSGGQTQAAKTFLDYLTSPEAQTILVQNGFRPVTTLDLNSVPNSPWTQSIPGAQAQPSVTMQQAPDRPTLDELVRQWQRAN